MVIRTISPTVDHGEFADAVEPRLLHLRERLGLTDTQMGRDSSHCRSWTVLIDRSPARSCTVLAASAAPTANIRRETP